MEIVITKFGFYLIILAFILITYKLYKLEKLVNESAECINVNAYALKHLHDDYYEEPISITDYDGNEYDEEDDED